MNNKRVFGWVPDRPDGRDLQYSAIRPRKRLPQQVDLRDACSSVEQQGKLGSCTACALAGNLEYLDKIPDKRYTDVSRLFIYYNERVLENTVEYDSGASLRDGIKSLKRWGSCWEKTWPYIISRFDEKPSERSYEEACKHRIESYHRIGKLSEMMICLADGFPFVFGFTVYESFLSRTVKETGVVPMPKPEERALGGHAVMAVGYKNREKKFIVRNSWGSKWGKDGYCLMPFDYLETLARDFWTIRK